MSDSEQSSGYGYAPMMDEVAYESSYDSTKFMMGADAILVSDEDRQIIQTGELNLHVESVQDAVVAITTFVESKGGTVSNSNVTRGTNSYSGYMTLRVPSAEFDATVAGLKEMAVYVASEYINADDVTEYYTDLQTRLSNKQAEEAQYLEILDQTATVTETLAVTQALSNVRYEIESLQGQLKYYDSQVDDSTISIYLSEDESVSTVSETWKPVSTLKGALSDWVVFLQGAADAVVYLVIFGWPLLIVAWGVRAWHRRSKKSSKK